MSSLLTASIKVPGGKLLRLRTGVEAGKLVEPQLSGDFFLVPSESLPKIERFLHGWDLASPTGEQLLTRRLEKFLARERLQLAGVDASVIAQAVEDVRVQAGVESRPDTRSEQPGEDL